MTTADLTTEYTSWTLANQLPLIDANELLHASYCDVATEGGVTLTDEQRKWLSDFIVRWDEQQKKEDEQQSNVARKFSELLLRDIGADKLDEVNRRNAVHHAQGSGVCASHDFCDANMTMLEAMAEVLDTDENELCATLGEDNAVTALWGAAWNEAKENKFWRAA